MKKPLHLTEEEKSILIHGRIEVITRKDYNFDLRKLVVGEPDEGDEHYFEVKNVYIECLKCSETMDVPDPEKAYEGLVLRFLTFDMRIAILRFIRHYKMCHELTRRRPIDEEAGGGVLD